jgi:hypothetical protein
VGRSSAIRAASNAQTSLELGRLFRLPQASTTDLPAVRDRTLFGGLPFRIIGSTWSTPTVEALSRWKMLPFHLTLLQAHAQPSSF